ncbi:uncharacterized protein PFL1_03470 [Pseudozyma flocculosa PF-1]|uniref:beta-N-acetylhexosaminidase n=2 Tax=Pseudozyma flocculosa TaxID=84751 RepID=A0A5C3FBK5_9BASI|nr:uncharacterized protein PFL1_03470 [Pseudozyma flocculosa PF-1]EPQ29183.1 hypothetical protein PFL1_03470 [Pseudozyma flocculosa PF-1]SPO41516.1 related to putative exochitinase [Pseudozyma flocculosa]
MRFWTAPALLGLLLPTPSALALWPQPAETVSGHGFVQVPATMTIDFASSVDLARVPHDLTAQIAQVSRSIQEQPMRPLEVDRGASWRASIASAPKLDKVEISIVQLLARHPDTCRGNKERPSKRSQAPLQGTGAASQPGGDDSHSRCSISHWATRTLSTQVANDRVEIDVSRPVSADLPPREAEAYELDIDSDGRPAQIRAYTALGALRALKTLQQLVYSLDGPGAGAGDRLRFVRDVPLRIKDRPAFPYRGLLLDTSRNFYSTRALEQLLDGMALVKLNQFHWHITDAQSWPLSFSKGAGDEDGIDLSLLAARGSYGSDMVYSEDDVRSVIAYAGRRGINVNLEVDMPAHLKSGVEDISLGGSDAPAASDAKMIACSDEDNWPSFAAEPPSGQLNLRPTNQSTGVPEHIAAFARAVLARTASLTPSPYLSSGGDEPNLGCWRADSERDIDESIMKPFMGVVTDALTKAGKRGMVWEEMAIKFPATGASLGEGSIVEAWTTPDNVGAILSSNPGTLLIHAPSTHFYLDCGFGGWLGANPQGQSWCPYVTWQKTYTFDPYAGTKTQAERARVLGGESALWSEQIDETNLQQRAWPRAASAAEVFWTGASYTAVGPGDQVGKHERNGTEALARFLDVRERLVSLGINAEPIQPLWCVLRRGRCNLPT